MNQENQSAENSNNSENSSYNDENHNNSEINNTEDQLSAHEDTLDSSEEQKDISALESKITELQEQYIRSQAELQNQQKRYLDEIKKARDYAISNFAKDIIVVKDYLEMALLDKSESIEAIKTGVDLTLKQLIQIFERQLIKEISPKANEKLDPHLHQAVNTVEAQDQETNTIVSIMQKGYTLNERVLRPAMVTVAK